MKKFRLAVCLLVLSCMSLGATDMEHLFLDENAGVFNLLSRQSRLIMVDNYKSGSRVPFTNNMQGDSSKILLLTANELLVETSPARKVQARLLTSGKDSVIVVVETLSTPYLDSRITFYGTTWHRLPENKVISPLPSINMFFRPTMTENDRLELLSTALPMMTMTIENDKLVLRHSFKPQLLEHVYNKLATMLYPTVIYEIKGTKLKLVKNR